MEKAITIIVGIVVVALCCYIGYDIQQTGLRKKELDKKMSDNLDQQKLINKLIQDGLESGKLNVISLDTKNFSQIPSSNGKSKNKVKVKKEDAN